MKNIAICIGLWLAEGNNKCNNEITFTNNCPELIVFFHKYMSNLFKEKEDKIRLYIYNNSTKKVKSPLNKIILKNYIDKRANKPYFIWRLASVKLMKEWHKIIENLKEKEEFYIDILKGFFAGEGNIKFNSKSNSRALRIAQNKKNDFIEKILNHLNINFYFRANERNYIITGKWNWDIFAKNNLAYLHPIKKEKFLKVYNSYKEEHYPRFYLKKEILNQLQKPKTSKELGLILKRSQARISEILVGLKKENKVKYYRVESQAYWTKNNEIIISKIKNRYLRLLKENPKKTSEVAKILKICWKSANNRLFELKKLGLIDRNKKGKWYLIRNKEILII